MFRYIGLLLIVLIFTGCTSISEPQGKSPSGEGDVKIGSPATHGNLTIFPLYLSSYEETGKNYVTLEETLAQKQVEVREVSSSNNNEQQVEETNSPVPSQRQEQVLQQGDGATVNAVSIENKSKQPLYILAGQVIVGGKQDRVITKDTIVPPGQKIQVEVCCVEHGRWSPRENSVAGGGLCFAAALESNTQGSIRKIAQEKGESGQSEVWEEVAKSAKNLDAETSTGTYKQVVEKTQQKLEGYMKTFGSFEKDNKICGFVSCINGEVDSCDLFACPSLLAKFRKSLLRGYALDALNAEEATSGKKATSVDIEKFLKETESAKSNTEKLAEDKHRRVEKRESEKIIGFDNAAKCGKASMSIHKNYYKK